MGTQDPFSTSPRLAEAVLEGIYPIPEVRDGQLLDSGVQRLSCLKVARGLQHSHKEKADIPIHKTLQLRVHVHMQTLTCIYIYIYIYVYVYIYICICICICT